MRSDRILRFAFGVGAILASTIVLMILLFLGKESVLALESTATSKFFLDEDWYPSEGQYGLFPMVVATLLTTFGALLLAAPLGILCGIFCQSLVGGSLSCVLRATLGLLAGIPSVVLGFLGLVTLVPLIARLAPPGASLLAGILILGLMILPTIALVVDHSLSRVPAEIVLQAEALGLRRSTVIFRVMIPACRGGIAAGVCLGAARAIGETMAVFMVCGNVVQVPDSVFDPVRTLTANIALEMAYATGSHRSALFLGATVLVVLVSVLMVIANRRQPGESHA